MAKTSSGKDGVKGTWGNGKPTPIPPNNGPNPSGWPSTTGRPSGDERNNGPQKKNKGRSI